MFKRSPYAAFVREYPLKQAVLEQICEKEAETFANVSSQLHTKDILAQKP